MVFTTKYMKTQPAKAPKIRKFEKGGRVPSSRDVDPTRRDAEDSEQDVENYMRVEANNQSNYAKRGEKKFYDGGTEIPGWNAGENDKYRERRGYKRLIGNKSGEF
jgi:hypothetical protein